MAATIPVAILGFDTAERLALADSLRTSVPRSPAYHSVLGVDDARFVIADAGQPEALALLRTLGRIGDTLLVGAGGPDNAGARLPVPLEPARLLWQLDALLARQDAARARAAVAAAAVTSVPNLGAPAKPSHAVLTLPAAQPAAQAAAHRPSPWRQAHDARRQQREAALRANSVAPRTLLVDDSEIALHFLRRQLQRYGLQPDLARHSDRALDLLGQHAYDLVFLDFDLGDDSRVDGLTLCHQICRRMPQAVGVAPVVVMVSAFHDPVHQVRGTLAGAQAYLGKPLDPEALDRLMRQHGLRASLPANRPSD